MQKKVGDALYVLDLTPYVITEDTDVSIIYVQNEKMKEYKELNTELASKMHGFNQFIMTVQPRPWAEEDGGDSGDTLYTLTVHYSSAFAIAVDAIDLGSLTHICGKGDETHQPSLTGVTDWILPSSITKDEQNQYVAEVVYSNIPEGWQFQFDERPFPAGFNLTSSPVLENGTEPLWGVGQTYVMPASDVTITLTAQDDVQPGEKEYLSPRIANVNNDVYNFNVGEILNVKDNTALVNAVEFTGHVEQGSTSSLGQYREYLLGTPFSYKFDENNSAKYFNLYYQPTKTGHKFYIYLADVANDRHSTNYYTIDNHDLNSLEDDHTYRVGLSIDISDAQTKGDVHITPTFAIDGITCSPRDSEDNVLESPQRLDFDISQGTQGLEDWISNFQSKLYLFSCVKGDNWGEFITADVPFELSTVKVEYSTGADLSQLQLGTTTTPWILTATSPTHFDDGINDWSLSPMRDLVPNVPHIFKLTGDNIHAHVQVLLNGVKPNASADDFVEGLLVAEGTNILIRALESSEHYTLESGSINWSNDEQAWYTNMPNVDLEIVINYNDDPR